MNKLLVFFVGVILMSVFISASLDIVYDNSNNPKVIIEDSILTDGGNSSFNETYINDSFIRRTGINVGENTNFNNYNISGVSSMFFNTAGCTEDTQAGTLCWNADKSTLDMVTGLGNTIQVGQETTYTIKNKAGKTIYAGQIISVNGSSGEIIEGVLANSSHGHLIHNLAMVTIPSCNDNAECQVTTIGEVHDLNTLGFTEGDSIYLNQFGNFTSTPESFPKYNIHLGTVSRVHATTGIITFNPELDIGDGVVMHSYVCYYT